MNHGAIEEIELEKKSSLERKTLDARIEALITF